MIQTNEHTIVVVVYIGETRALVLVDNTSFGLKKACCFKILWYNTFTRGDEHVVFLKLLLYRPL